MSDDRGRLLLDASLDQALSAEEQAELEQLLAQSEPLRQQKAALEQLDSMLRDTPQAPLPDGLHDRIVNAIELPEPKPARRGWRLPGFLRYGLATAAGLVIAIGIYEMTPSLDSGTGYNDMMGTMVPTQSRNVVLLDSLALERDGLVSSARLESRDGVMVLTVSVDTSEPVSVEASVADQPLSFGALSQADSQFESFEFGDRRVYARGRGRQQFTVLLKSRGKTPSKAVARIKLRYEDNGGWAHEDQLVVDGNAEDSSSQ